MTSRPGRTDNAQWRRAKAQAVKDAQGQCQLCGGPLAPDEPKLSPWSTHIDHIMPLAAGGAPYDRSNLRAVHARCNLRRDRGQQPLQPPAAEVAAWIPPDPWVPCPTCPNPCSYVGRPASRCW